MENGDRKVMFYVTWLSKLLIFKRQLSWLTQFHSEVQLPYYLWRGGASSHGASGFRRWSICNDLKRLGYSHTMLHETFEVGTERRIPQFNVILKKLLQKARLNGCNEGLHCEFGMFLHDPCKSIPS